MFHESREKFSEQPKACLSKKINSICDLFRREKLVRDEKIISDMEEVKEEIEKRLPEQIAQGNHMAHMIGQIETKLGFVFRLKKIPEKKEANVDKVNNRMCREIVLQNKETLRSYLELCLKSKDFFYGEISSQSGFWGKETLDGKDESKEIASLDADEFTQISREKIMEK